MLSHKRRHDRGSTLIYHLKTIRSRTHFPCRSPARAYSRWPRLSDGLLAVLFPFNAIWNSHVFYHPCHILVKDSLCFNLPVLCKFKPGKPQGYPVEACQEHEYFVNYTQEPAVLPAVALLRISYPID